jgi:hypothetical protein
MTKISQRKSKLRFEVETEIYAPGSKTFTLDDGSKMKTRFTRRKLIVECDEYTVTMRLKGTQQRLPVDWEGVYVLAAKKEASRVLAEKKAKRAARKGGK